jgi:hypothetical protein
MSFLSSAPSNRGNNHTTPSTASTTPAPAFAAVKKLADLHDEINLRVSAPEEID